MPEHGVGLDIAQLVRRAADGDWWAGERLIDQYGRPIWAMTHDFQLAENDAAEGVQAPWRWRRMLELLMADPPASYAEISDQLGLPVGSIGPTRSRSLERLRTILQAS